MALNACWKVSVFVTTVVERPKNAHAPTGSGVKTSPVIVDRKIASNVHACGFTPPGQGIKKFTTTPTAIEIAVAPSFAPFHTNSVFWESDEDPKSAAEKVTALAEAVGVVDCLFLTAKGLLATPTVLNAQLDWPMVARKDNLEFVGTTRAAVGEAVAR